MRRHTLTIGKPSSSTAGLPEPSDDRTEETSDTFDAEATFAECLALARAPLDLTDDDG